MGNAHMSCCRSTSPRSHHLSNRNHLGNDDTCSCVGDYGNHRYSKHPNATHNHNKHNNHRHNHDNIDDQQPSGILQHISEREPDDSENDPSSNPFNQPIFVTRLLNPLSVGQRNSDETDQNEKFVIRTNIRLLDCEITSKISGNNAEAGRSFRLFNAHSRRNSSQINPAFLNPCHRKIKATDYQEHNNFTHPSKHWLVKSSSCSTIFTDDSTISQPDLKLTIKCVSLAIYYHIKHRSSDRMNDIFDEVVYPLRMPMNNHNDDNSDVKRKTPHNHDLNQRTIYEFVKTLFNAAQLTSEYAITTLVYLERLMTYAEIDLTPRTWRRMFLGAILLSSKVWEDQAVWNVDYAQILEEISVEDINELERQFLELIQFNMNVPSSVYAKYYFNLRTLALENGLSAPNSILTIQRSRNLEAMSRACLTSKHSSPLLRKNFNLIKRHSSLENMRNSGLTRAVLM